MSGSTTLSIRPATEADIPVILEMVKALAVYEKMLDEVTATPDRIRESLLGPSPHAHTALGEVQGEAVGIAIYFFNYSTFLSRRGLYLEDLFVKEAFRGRGYGGQILRYLARVAVENECGRFEWTVLDWNQPAIKFYEKMGARVLKEWRICRVTDDALAALGVEPE
ncbi:MAG: hypothetical protein M2R45_03618 [Verrucomicrobia subdivision 3 bacterium]|nr:hypothetical protein [Limisphaerales bacterium]MCS1416887.1 hypothetical protein [Limisphaerales bacterium]